MKMKTGKGKMTNKQINKQMSLIDPHVQTHIHFESTLLTCLKWNRIQNQPGNPKQRKINNVSSSCKSKSNSSSSRSNSQNFRIDECTSFCFYLFYTPFLSRSQAKVPNIHHSPSSIVVISFYFIFSVTFSVCCSIFFVVIVDSFESFALLLSLRQPS